MLESQANYLAAALATMRAEGLASVDVRPEAQTVTLTAHERIAPGFVADAR